MHPLSDLTAPAVLVIAHPGHELRVHHWLEREHPHVFVLTDGSGHSQPSRLPSTQRTLSGAGAYAGGLFGRFTDRELYAALLAGNHQLFIEVVWELAESFEKLGAAVVAADACEGYNPVHDACRWMVDAAVALVRAGGKGDPGSYDFTLIAPPNECPPELRLFREYLSLDEAAFNRKLAAAYEYPELAAELEAALRSVGADAFRHEFLRPASLTVPGRGIALRPRYEEFGERRVGDGLYRDVIRYREHMEPLATALYSLSGGAVLAAA